VYDPHEHADRLNITVIYDDNLPDDRCGEYRFDHGVVVIRPDLGRVRERCVLAHEIVHWEQQDYLTGDARLDAKIERNADLVAARRLIGRPISSIAAGVADNLSVLARELDVTPRILRVYLEAGEHHRFVCGFVA
jgi:Zn-dependent peptidase ImmA (M78 family)